MDIFDINSPYEFIITFSDIFMISSLLTWQTDTSKNFLHLVKGEEACKINKKFQVEQGYSIFKFLVDDYNENNEFIIIAKSIDYQIPLETSSI